MSRRSARNSNRSRRRPPPDGPLILFDGVCNLCNGLVRFVLERDRGGRIWFGAMQSPAGREILRRLGRPTDRYATMLLLEDGAVFEKSDAALRIAGMLPPPWRWLRLLRLLPAGMRDSAYDTVARHRYRIFGRREECRAPGPGERDRFLPMD